MFALPQTILHYNHSQTRIVILYHTLMRRMPDGLGNVLQSPSHLLTNIAMLIIVNISCYGE
jgi:hypothetical protein